MTEPVTGLTPTSYNRYSRYLHWLMAFLILFMVFLGWRFDDKDSLIFTRANLHKSIGILIILLTLLRIALRLAYKAPPEPPMPKWQAWAAQALHVGFYVVMIGLPLSGWLMVSTSTREIPFFGLAWPHLPVPQTHDAHETFEAAHGLIAKLLFYVMIPLHVVAALKHQFIDKDTVVEHMVPGLKPRPILNYRWLLPIGVVGLAVVLGFGVLRGKPQARNDAPPPVASVASSEAPEVSASVSEAASSVSETASASQAAAVTNWIVDKSATKIAFSTSLSGEAINGGFSSYSAAIAFDLEQLDKSHVKVTIDLSSVSSGDNDRDGSLKSDAFFNVAVTPKAVFEATSFTKTDATHFVAKGRLTLHGKSQPLTLPFSLIIKNDTATMTGSTTIDRTAFGVGSGEWAATDSLPAKVKVDINLKAKAAK
ncbi:YceI family protein [Asticcacaulis sp. 201]|uniref:YceI family protein n=1 Tax=Asticcacaulis sp. 201 TaxID=3028787 RepID=UPI0029164A28|nr:YceI family protein [Asticcacaulis sp. 201]MDV6332909.1 YceI family protein [Asticcacaulis sp. 201]